MGLIIMLVGPIDYWWNENWHSEKHETYMAWRNELNQKLVEAGHLVYRPHEAFKGAWNEFAQIVNNAAIAAADVLIDMNPGVPAYGTEAELVIARNMQKRILQAPPGDYSKIADLVEPLADPYGTVTRKTYTKPVPHSLDCQCDRCTKARNQARDFLAATTSTTVGGNDDPTPNQG